MQPNVKTVTRTKPTFLRINLATNLATRYERGLPGRVVNIGHATMGTDQETHALLASKAGLKILECYRKTGRLE